MGKELKVRDETFALARRMAEDGDRSVEDVIADALQRMADERRVVEDDHAAPAVDPVIEAGRRDIEARRAEMLPPDGDIFSEEAIALRRERRLALVAENRRHLRERPTIDEADFYDEHGLPK